MRSSKIIIAIIPLLLSLLVILYEFTTFDQFGVVLFYYSLIRLIIPSEGLIFPLAFLVPLNIGGLILLLGGNNRTERSNSP